MSSTHAWGFVAVGLGMIAGPAVWAEHFGPDQMRSAAWLVFMGGVQATGGACVLLSDAVRVARRLIAWLEASLEISVSLADLHRVALPASFYALIDEPEEVALARRLQRQLLRVG